MSRKYNRSGHEPKWLAEWRRKKRAGISTGPTAHLKYGKLARKIEKSLDLERPPLSDLGADELARLEAKYADLA